jgi:hypothetical protein
MSRKMDAVRIPAVATVPSATTGVIDTPAVKPGVTMVCQSIAFRNRTGARGTVTIQLRSGGAVFPISDQASPSANQFYSYPYPIDVHEGEQIEASQLSCSQSDILDLVVIGYLLDDDEEEVA